MTVLRCHKQRRRTVAHSFVYISTPFHQFAGQFQMTALGRGKQRSPTVLKFTKVIKDNQLQLQSVRIAAKCHRARVAAGKIFRKIPRSSTETGRAKCRGSPISGHFPRLRGNSTQSAVQWKDSNPWPCDHKVYHCANLAEQLQIIL